MYGRLSVRTACPDQYKLKAWCAASAESGKIQDRIDRFAEKPSLQRLSMAHRNRLSPISTHFGRSLAIGTPPSQAINAVLDLPELGSRVSPVPTRMRTTRETQQGPSVDNQVLILNHRELLWSKATLVLRKSPSKISMGVTERASAIKTPVEESTADELMSKPGVDPLPR
jgi:hypothetical protein